MSTGGSWGIGSVCFFGAWFIVRMLFRFGGSDGSELIRPMEELLAHQKTIVEVTQAATMQLSKVEDAESALASLSELQAALETCTSTRDEVDLDYSDVGFGSLLNISDATVARMEEIGDEMEGVAASLSEESGQIIAEIERIEELVGLPAEFWDVMRGTLARHASIAYSEQMDFGYLDDESFDDEDEYVEDYDEYVTSPKSVVYDNLATLIEQHGSSKVLMLRVSDLSRKEFSQLCRDLREVEGGAARVKKWFDAELEEGYTIVGPTEGFQAYLDKLPDGKFSIQEESRRTIMMRVVAKKEEAVAEDSGAVPEENTNLVAERATAEPPEFEQPRSEPPRFGEPVTDQPGIDQPGIEKPASEVELPKLPEDEQQLGEDDSVYYARLAGLMISAEQDSVNAKVIEKILEIEPSNILEKNTRVAIAKNFRQLTLEAEGQREQELAIQGLAKYGGKYCVPILLEMRKDGKVKAREEFLTVLGQYPNEKAGEAVVQLFMESPRDEKVLVCLRKMGPSAEIPLIQAARTDDQALELTIIELLGDVGTKKSFALMRKGTRSKDKKMSELAKESTLKIRKRILAEKEAAPSS